MLRKNDIIKLNIGSVTLQGSGVGRHEGLAVFVPMTAAGDEIEAHILKVKSNCAFAKVHKIINPSPDRTEADCPAYAKCGGCVFRHISYEAELEIKEKFCRDVMKRIGGLDIPCEKIVGSESRRECRNKAQFPLEKTADGVKIGFFSPHSHRVNEARFCPLQPKEFAGILNVFEEYIKRYNVSVYDETAHKGLLRHIYLRKAAATGEIMVCPVINGKALPEEERLCSMLLGENGNIKSIIINENREKTNVILGGECRTVYGADYITDELCSLKFRISPLSFYQVNPAGAEKLYEKAAQFACPDGGQTLLDLYCGTGTIGLTMAKNAKEVIGVEIIPQAIEDAKINAAINGIENARFMCADASEAAKKLESEGVKPDVVILDPPRKGCAKDVLETVAQMAPDKIVYISCDPATQARDAAILAGLGYTAEKLCPVDMFPGCGHCESVLQLIRSDINS
ncbi:MAG: 23S rRNA (uracil(1939)-C(5))-methyltransferase RlmD [Clostridia bacterium]|nr:23S rRNA (uracil(1939)-C(5))-methyltransferase RlmD [Clostridia bacterium]